MRGPLTREELVGLPATARVYLYEKRNAEAGSDPWWKANRHGYVAQSKDAHAYPVQEAIGMGLTSSVTYFLWEPPQPPSPPAPRLNISEVREKFDELKAKMCLIYHKDRGYWVSIPCEGHTKDRRRGVVVSVEGAMERKLVEGDHFIELVPRIVFEHYADSSLVDMAKVAPNNDQVRGRIMSRFGCCPVGYTMTYPELKEWIETHTVLPDRDMAVVDIAIPTNPNFGIRLDFGDIELGTADTTQRRVGHASYEFGRERISEIIQGQDLSNIEELVEFLRQECSDDGWELGPVMRTSGSREISNYTITDHSEETCNPTEGPQDTETRLRNYMRMQFTTEQLNEMEFSVDNEEHEWMIAGEDEDGEDGQ